MYEGHRSFPNTIQHPKQLRLHRNNQGLQHRGLLLILFLLKLCISFSVSETLGPISPMLQNVHTVSFSRPGFVELSPMVFDVSSEITLSFSTKNENGIILYGRGGVSTTTHLTQSIQNQNPFQKPGRKRRQTGEVS